MGQLVNVEYDSPRVVHLIDNEGHKQTCRMQSVSAEIRQTRFNDGNGGTIMFGMRGQTSDRLYCRIANCDSNEELKVIQEILEGKTALALWGNEPVLCSWPNPYGLRLHTCGVPEAVPA